MSSMTQKRFGRNGEFVVVCSPTDQGYFEPDTSALLRLKLASEYGYGINPATVVTDKVNLLGTGAHPFWRYIEGACRAPSGLGRIQVSIQVSIQVHNSRCLLLLAASFYLVFKQFFLNPLLLFIT